MQTKRNITTIINIFIIFDFFATYVQRQIEKYLVTDRLAQLEGIRNGKLYHM